jgi:hypothetical protein
MHAVTPTSKCSWSECPNNTGNENILKRCSRCREALYCNQTCQAGDWLKHKVICKSAASSHSAKQLPKDMPPDSTKTSAESLKAIPSEQASSQSPSQQLTRLFGSAYGGWAIGRKLRLEAALGKTKGEAMHQWMDQQFVNFLGQQAGLASQGAAPNNSDDSGK